MKSLLLLLLTAQLFGQELNYLLLRAQASIFPKIMLLDQDVSKKVSDKTIFLIVIHNNEEEKSAQKLKELINDTYKGELGSYNFIVELANSQKNAEINYGTAYYFFSLKENAKKQILSEAKSKNRISFGYDNENFNGGILISMMLKEKTYIYLNRTSLSDYNISFTPVFYKIIKVKE